MSIKRIITSPLFYIPLLAISIFLMTIVVFVATVKWGFWGSLPSDESLSMIRHNEGTIVYDYNGEILGRYFLIDHRSAKYENFPKHLIEALVATEDVRFYEHSGIDYKSLARVLIKTLILQDRSGGGGSTLSMQLAKNLFPREDFSAKGLLVAKIKEAFIAQQLESIYSKDDILELYLNTVSFPDNTYGIESASQKFFSKPVSQLTPTEVAILVGSLKATSTYNSRTHPENSLGRRNTVLSQMHKYGFLSDSSYTELTRQPLTLAYNRNSNSEAAPYFLEQVRKQLKDWIAQNPKADGTGYNLYTDGLKVKTTLDLTMQLYAEAAMKKHMANIQKQFQQNWGEDAPWHAKADWILEKLYQLPQAQTMSSQGMDNQAIMNKLTEKREMTLFNWEGQSNTKASTLDSLIHYTQLLNTGFVAVDPADGAVRSWIGGIDYGEVQFDHVIQAKRQVGSTFKPFVYGAAIENGIDPCSYFSARAVQYENMEGWTPSNSGSETYKNQNLTMRAALTNSVNTVAIKVLEETGIQPTIEFARNFNIKSELPAVPSLALGTAELSVLELAGAYAAFVNDQRPVIPYLILEIRDKNGQILYEHESVVQNKAMRPETAAMVREMMISVVNEGTASRLRSQFGLQQAIAGKTGTTQSNKDGWFVGITPKLVTVTWVGADDPRVYFRNTSIGQGANAALPLFGHFYRSMAQNHSFKGYTQAKFPAIPSSIKQAMDCPPIKEDGFLKRVFTNEDKPKVKDFGEEEKKGLFSKVKDLFKKKDGGND